MHLIINKYYNKSSIFCIFALMEYLTSANESQSPIEADVRVSFTKIYDVDTLNQRFQAEILIESKWYDPSVKTMKQDVNSLEWTPELYIENAISESKHEVFRKIIQQESKLVVFEVQKIKGIFWENLELENFPLDIQNLSIMVLSKKSEKKIKLNLMQEEMSRIKISNNLEKSNWYLHEVVKASLEKVDREYSFGKKTYPGVQITCQAFRSPGFFYWNAILPIVLISFASLGPFVIDFKSASSRLPSTATMLLSSVSYKALISRLLPTVSYLTSLDKYSLTSITLIAFMFIYHSILAAFNSVVDDTMGYFFDKIAFLSRIKKSFFSKYFDNFDNLVTIKLKQIKNVLKSIVTSNKNVSAFSSEEKNQTYNPNKKIIEMTRWTRPTIGHVQDSSLSNKEIILLVSSPIILIVKLYKKRENKKEAVPSKLRISESRNHMMLK
ncbi:gamma aminobutyric acid receptor subunit [Brachionus plicatilis]|uniref:Gamma aminobutyric acid receptor subunit n=1 Tax=Brachionus plicatilis TaxID=10195 RepID=A0A3M7RKT6_BRAPC|nr:gamma aminobutyric acid receptor subunit [Brachionus plicatilis]